MQSGRFLSGGVEAANIRFASSGTLGLIVRDLDTGAPLALGSCHAWVSRAGREGDAIVQPRSKSPDAVIGELTRWHRGYDAAIARLNHTREICQQVQAIGEPRSGMRVIKIGMMSGLTHGIVAEAGGVVRIAADPERVAWHGCLSLPGDSGAVWLDASTGHAVALHSGRDAVGACAYPLSVIAEVLQFGL